MSLATTYHALRSELDANDVRLVAVSKTYPPEKVMELYALGQRDFGENKVQELLEKKRHLPDDIRWHLIGHLQSNKIRMIVPEVAMIQSVDSMRLLHKLSAEARDRTHPLDVLLQVKIAEEDTKYGFDANTLGKHFEEEGVSFPGIQIRGLMGMATFTDNDTQVRREFQFLKQLFVQLQSTVFAEVPGFDQISMGMSGDYRLAIEEGSTSVRIGSLLFGART